MINDNGQKQVDYFGDRDNYVVVLRIDLRMVYFQSAFNRVLSKLDNITVVVDIHHINDILLSWRIFLGTDAEES